MSVDAGRLKTRLRPGNNNTENTTTAVAINATAAHCRPVNALSRTRIFGELLFWLNEFAELDQRVEQRLRDLILLNGRGELAFLVHVREIPDFNERGRHVRADQHPQRQLLHRARAHLDLRAQRLLDESGEGGGLLEISSLRGFPQNQV